MSRPTRQERRRLNQEKAIKALRQQLLKQPESSKTGWFDLPYEMRRMVIDEMDTKCKARFAMCSKVCYNEVGMSKKYIEGLEFGQFLYTYNMVRVYLHEDISFEMSYERFDKVNFRYYCKNFITGNKIPKCDILRVPINFVRKVIETTPNLKKLKIESMEYFPFAEMSIQHLKKLKIIKIFQKLCREDYVDLIECKFIDPKQLYKIEKIIHINGVSLTCDQLINLKAKKIRLRPIKLSSKQINQYLQLVMCGELHENVEKVKLTMDKNYELNSEEIIDGLKIFKKYNEDDVTWFDLKIQMKPKNLAKIRITPSTFLLVRSCEETCWEDYADDEDNLRYDSFDGKTDWHQDDSDFEPEF